MATIDYYKGRESVWKELYSNVCTHTVKLEDEIRELKDKIQIQTDNENTIQSQKQQINHVETKYSEL